MTVKELKEWLNEYPDDAECFVFDSELGHDRPVNQSNFSINSVPMPIKNCDTCGHRYKWLQNL